MRTVTRTLVSTLCLTLMLAGCSQIEGAVDNALSAALRTAASQALKQAAERSGHPLKGDPACTGDVASQTKSATITCTATTEIGESVTATVTITNAGNPKTCTGEMVIKIADNPPINERFPACGG